MMPRKDINWITLKEEIKSTPGAQMVLRALLGHGITHLVQFNDNSGTGIAQSCSIDMILDDIARGY